MLVLYSCVSLLHCNATPKSYTYIYLKDLYFINADIFLYILYSANINIFHTLRNYVLIA